MRRVLVAAIVLAAAASAHAQARDKAAGAKAYADGTALYTSGDYRGAADKFRLAYERDPDPVYLFNVAQADRFAKLCHEAADEYRRFLVAAPSAPNRDKVQKYIDEMDACAKTQVIISPAPTPPEPVAPQPTPVEPQVAHPSPKLMAPEEPEAHQAAGHRNLTYALAGVGAIALVFGGYFTYDLHDAERQQSHCNAAPTNCDGKTIRDLDDRGARDNIAVPVTLGVAGVALAASIVLFVHDRHAERAVAVAPTNGGAMVTGVLRF